VGGGGVVKVVFSRARDYVHLPPLRLARRAIPAR
jgi:hypothetical protein